MTDLKKAAAQLLELSKETLTLSGGFPGTLEAEHFKPTISPEALSALQNDHLAELAAQGDERALKELMDKSYFHQD